MQLGIDDLRTTYAEQPDILVGTPGQTPDGRIFRLAKAGATALDPGKLTVAATQASAQENIAVAVAAPIGATQVTVTLGAEAVAANAYAQGQLAITDGTGEGISYLISGHPAAGSAGTLVVTLVEPLKVALATTTEVCLVKNTYSDIVISATDQADAVAGVPNVAIPAANWGWVQTKGDCAVWADETVTAGKAITIGTGAAGQVEQLDAAGEPEIGVAKQALVDTEYRLATLSID